MRALALATAMLLAQGAGAGSQSAPTTARTSSARSAPVSTAQSFSQNATTYQARRWGVDQLRVRSTASGSMLEFSYRVVNPERAAALNDKRVTPYMIDKATGRKLTVPTMEKIGSLRQTSTPEQGREYWMVFGNPGKSVKPTQRVDIVIGTFRANDITVE